jgi:hypothetical protein
MDYTYWTMKQKISIKMFLNSAMESFLTVLGSLEGLSIGGLIDGMTADTTIPLQEV